LTAPPAETMKRGQGSILGGEGSYSGEEALQGQDGREKWGGGVKHPSGTTTQDWVVRMTKFEARSDHESRKRRTNMEKREVRESPPEGAPLNFRRNKEKKRGRTIVKIGTRSPGGWPTSKGNYRRDKKLRTEVRQKVLFKESLRLEKLPMGVEEDGQEPAMKSRGSNRGGEKV